MQNYKILKVEYLYLRKIVKGAVLYVMYIKRLLAFRE